MVNHMEQYLWRGNTRDVAMMPVPWSTGDLWVMGGSALALVGLPFATVTSDAYMGQAAIITAIGGLVSAGCIGLTRVIVEWKKADRSANAVEVLAAKVQAAVTAERLADRVTADVARAADKAELLKALSDDRAGRDAVMKDELAGLRALLIETHGRAERARPDV